MLRVVEAFSGIGSQLKALKKLGIEYRIENTIEWDICAFYAYDIIHNGEQDLSPYESFDKQKILEILNGYSLSFDGKTPINTKFIKTWKVEALRKVLCALKRTHNLGSITEITANALPRIIDLLTYSFPCQDLSICGSWHGNMSGIDRNAHNRSGMLWEVERLLKELHSSNRDLPKFMLMENVSNILSKTHRSNFSEWQHYLEQLGYFNKVYTLNASNFGSPQKRVRTYMLSILCKDEESRHITLQYFTEHDLEKQSPVKSKPLSEYLRTNYSIKKYKDEADCSNPNKTPSRCKILDDNEIIFDGKKTVTETVNTLTTKQDRNPTSGLIKYLEHSKGKMIYRNFTPRECFLMMGFDENDYERLVNSNFKINTTKYIYGREKFEKLAGNSIVVNVLEAIFSQVNDLKKTLWPTYYDTIVSKNIRISYMKDVL